MKRQLINTILMAGLSAILGSPTISAQEQTVIADIPFAFEANHATLHAGKYFVHRDTVNGIVRISKFGGEGAFLSSLAAVETKSTDPRLTFNCYGEDCVLSTVWMPNGIGYSVNKSANERHRNLTIASSVRSVRLSAR